MKTCLNCNSPVNDAFCSKCGQKISTRRYSIKYFFTHDFIHGVLYLDRGLLYTIKELCVRPGHSTREYVEGKRAKLINSFTFLLLVIMIGHFLSEYSSIKIADLVNSESKEYISDLEGFSIAYPRIFILITIPIYALFSFFWFRKPRQNFTEHLVLNTYKASGELIISALFTLLTIFYHNINVLVLVFSFLSFSLTAYSTWFYYQYFSTFGYKKPVLLIRSFMAVISIIFLSAIITMIISAISGK